MPARAKGRTRRYILELCGTQPKKKRAAHIQMRCSFGYFATEFQDRVKLLPDSS